MQKRKVALITGSSRGIGRSIALALAERGWTIVVNYCRNRQAALRVLEQAGGKGMILQADVARPADRERLVTEILDRLGRIDLLVNNAGTAPRQRVDLLQVNEASYDQVMDVNLKGPFFLTQRVARAMVALIQEGVLDHPQIVNIGSISAYTSSPARAEYCLSKAGMAMMTRLYADRLAEYGIGVYEIRPGVIETDMTRVVQDKYDRLIAEGLTPIRRWGQPQDVARAVVAVAEGHFPFSTGEVINVDGGFHIRRL